MSLSLSVPSRSWSERESLIISGPLCGSFWATRLTCRWRTSTLSCWRCHPPVRSSSVETLPAPTLSMSSSKVRTAWGRKSSSTSWRWAPQHLRILTLKPELLRLIFNIYEKVKCLSFRINVSVVTCSKVKIYSYSWRKNCAKCNVAKSDICLLLFSDIGHC